MEANNRKSRLVHYFSLLLLCIALQSELQVCHAQDSVFVNNTFNKKRLRIIAIGTTVGYTASMTGLYHIWYRHAEQQSFRFFNDNKEWKQVDKLGHFGSAFYMSYAAHRGLLWTGMSKKKSDMIAAATGFLVMLPIEIFDGFSNAYGASTGDLIANAGGATLFYSQQALWNEVRVYPKFSFHTTKFAKQRPELLGENKVNQFFKDYNGQTYWFSIDVDKFTAFPKWLNIAVGYGAENMIYARDDQNEAANLNPYRQYYITLDFDLTSIKTRSKAVKTLIFLANIIKIPAPALSFSKHGVSGYGLYF
jgi:hypothetical protein